VAEGGADIPKPSRAGENTTRDEGLVLEIGRVKRKVADGTRTRERK